MKSLLVLLLLSYSSNAQLREFLKAKYLFLDSTAEREQDMVDSFTIFIPEEYKKMNVDTQIYGRNIDQITHYFINKTGDTITIANALITSMDKLVSQL